MAVLEEIAPAAAMGKFSIFVLFTSFLYSSHDRSIFLTLNSNHARSVHVAYYLYSIFNKFNEYNGYSQGRNKDVGC